ncbi:hypothetical protein [Nocardioides sp. Root151]|uniref:hypothetical protein n=1 Tax=Nocardioides sp. Root151 TaxID=1736475 RepID=UPI000702F3D4|nr:hypothetical protein [Nocardioides sp. Root151]KQZ76033.1 hypothetical protein ASD66_07005 [Nocardioides sp. Root151]
MTDHNPTDDQLPPERPLDEQSKARMRAELTEAIGRSDADRPRHAWLVPTVAAAAMVGIAALGAGLFLNGDDDGRDRSGEIAPAGSGTASDPDPTVKAPDPPVSTMPGEGSTTEKIPENEMRMEPPVPCADEVGNLLSAARLAGSTTYDEGTAQLWTDGATWVICDDWAATSDGGVPTLIGNRSTNDVWSKQTYALSQNYSMDDHLVGQYVAGGPTLPDVASISYTFPDGHTQDAVIGKDMWLMTYVATSGPLVDQTAETEPVRVRVTFDDGTTASYDLQWGQDTCAQINHGC